jgi:hypothetical protein
LKSLIEPAKSPSGRRRPPAPGGFPLESNILRHDEKEKASEEESMSEKVLVPQRLCPVIAEPDRLLAFPVAAIIGIPIYIRAETMIPIGLALIEKGMSVGAVLALVIGGAGASIPELTLLSAIFEKKLLAAFVLTIFTIAVAAGYVANLLAL